MQPHASRHSFWKELPKPFLVLAPMDNVTEVSFREVLTILPRPEVYFTEFTNVTGLNSKGREKTLERLEFTPNQRPIVAQIWGTNPEHYFLSAQLIEQLGFDGIDINMGCPDRTVMKGGAGSALICNPNLAKELIDATKRGAPSLPVSVKTRLGYNKLVTEEWAETLLSQDIAVLTMHGRIAKEMSKYPANWDEIAKVVKIKNEIAPATLVVGNGDVLSYQQALDYHEQYGVDGAMIGRGLFADPWVFEKTLPKPVRDKQDYLRILATHISLHHKRWGDTYKFEQLKKFFKMYVKDFPGASELRAQLMQCSTQAETMAILNEHIHVRE